MDKALSGVRVIDMTHNQAGPACAQILAFLGADVIKLEEPRWVMSRAPLHARRQEGSDSLFFLMFNANKRSLTLNLKSDEGQASVQARSSPSRMSSLKFSGRGRWNGWGSAGRAQGT